MLPLRYGRTNHKHPCVCGLSHRESTTQGDHECSLWLCCGEDYQTRTWRPRLVDVLSMGKSTRSVHENTQRNHRRIRMRFTWWNRVSLVHPPGTFHRYPRACVTQRYNSLFRLWFHFEQRVLSFRYVSYAVALFGHTGGRPGSRIPDL